MGALGVWAARRVSRNSWAQVFLPANSDGLAWSQVSPLILHQKTRFLRESRHLRIDGHWPAGLRREETADHADELTSSPGNTYNQVIAERASTAAAARCLGAYGMP